MRAQVPSIRGLRVLRVGALEIRYWPRGGYRTSRQARIAGSGDRVWTAVTNRQTPSDRWAQERYVETRSASR